MMEEFYRIEVKEVMIPLHKTPHIEENAGWSVFLKKLSLRAHAWVVNNTEEMKVVGVVTEHDMMRSMIPPGQKKERMFGVPRAEILHKESVVQDIMTHNPVVCLPQETVADVLKKFSSFDIRRLAVVDENNRLLGEVTIQRLLKKLRLKFMNMI
ncbi:MAG: CBS domain-containing protein [Dehalococcoidia bacterium]|nr:CBS domain-containing protein [Dehalococcoidia bacterium]